MLATRGRHSVPGRIHDALRPSDPPYPTPLQFSGLRRVLSSRAEREVVPNETKPAPSRLVNRDRSPRRRVRVVWHAARVIGDVEGCFFSGGLLSHWTVTRSPIGSRLNGVVCFDVSDRCFSAHRHSRHDLHQTNPPPVQRTASGAVIRRCWTTHAWNDRGRTLFRPFCRSLPCVHDCD